MAAYFSIKWHIIFYSNDPQTKDFQIILDFTMYKKPWGLSLGAGV